MTYDHARVLVRLKSLTRPVRDCQRMLEAGVLADRVQLIALPDDSGVEELNTICSVTKFSLTGRLAWSPTCRDGKMRTTFCIRHYSESQKGHSLMCSKATLDFNKSIRLPLRVMCPC